MINQQKYVLTFSNHYDLSYLSSISNIISLTFILYIWFYFTVMVSLQLTAIFFFFFLSGFKLSGSICYDIFFVISSLKAYFQ